MGNVIAVCTSPAKGTQKTNVGTAQFQADWGIVGDAHAGKWHRQVSLLSWDKIEAFRARGAEVKDGDFGENLVVSGIDFRSLPIGTKFRCNDVVLGGRKLCGILTEASLLPDGSAEWLVVGIGVNVGQREFPGDIAEIATSLALQGLSASTDALGSAILEQLTALRGALDDPAEWLKAYRARCVTVGRRVEVQRRGASRRGTVLDVDDRFGLVVRYENGETETIRSGEVSVRGLCGYIE